MNINLFLVPFVIILGIFFGNNDTKVGRRHYIWLCSAVLIFVAAMRSPEWTANNYGIDTMSYKMFFESTMDLDWNGFWAKVIERYVGLNDDSDVGFLGFVRIICFFTHDFAFYSLIADLIFFIPFGILLYRYCERTIQITFAFVFYIALLQVFFLGGGRQMFAIGFDLMALLATFDRKKIQTIIFFSLIAISIHFSAILFIVPLLMIWLNIKAKTLKFLHLICLLLFPIVFAFPNQLIVFMGNFVGMEKYANYGKAAVAGGANTFIVLILFLSLLCYIAIKRDDLTRNNILRMFYVMVPMMTFFAPLIQSNGSMIRISLYYHLFLSLLVSYAIDCMDVRWNRSFMYIMAIGGLAFLTMFNSGAKYYFYWQ